MTSGRHTQNRPISIERALTDDDYYHEIRARPKNNEPALKAFEAAGDAAWREKHARTGRPRYRGRGTIPAAPAPRIRHPPVGAGRTRVRRTAGQRVNER